ncbi:hypothetical protein GLAREA_01647 [Glarea lozoyensis ATCC 20868]|uniref:C2H2-type domain-containing protein n=1 Tax=Glarea lozoyensis (strain ATCC 20868 / MF5171) TaxID=1116229 RepID=S3CIW0_GLAL2|nr:uncharacterized protein GLAREA_01647 [Glarea lozoyensis ATCC 20868]EPE25735.1 hypothetical protein GLAREA_01647 [Glarea lozoyensis ATCC 20868]
MASSEFSGTQTPPHPQHRSAIHAKRPSLRLCIASIGTRRQPKAPKHKASVARFLTWVAYVRNQSPSASLNLKKCPLIDCPKEEFADEKSMMKHLYACTQLPKGRIECLYCGRPEPIGRFHATEEDCNPLSCKSLIATALSPFRSPLSPRNSTAGKGFPNAPQMPQSTKTESDMPSYPHLAELSSKLDVSELPEGQISEIGYTPGIYELDVELTAELPSNFYGMGYGRAHYGHEYLFDLPGPRMLSDATFEQAFLAGGGTGNVLSPAAALNLHELPGVPVDCDCPQVIDDERTLYRNNTNSTRRYTAPISIPSSASRSAFGPSSSSTYHSSIFDDESMDSTGFRQEIATANTSPISPDVNESSSCNDRGFAPQNDCSDRRYATYDYFPDITEIQNFYSADECMQSPSNPLSSPSTLIENRSMAFDKSMTLASSSIADFQNPELDPPQDMRMTSHMITSPDHSYIPAFFDQEPQLPPPPITFVQSSPLQRPLPALRTSFTSSYEHKVIDASVSKIKGPNCPCGHQPSGKTGNRTSNLKRHRQTCKFGCSKALVKPAKCGFKGCGKSYTRFDNLKVHQVSKGHRPDIELEISFLDDPPLAKEVNGSPQNICSTKPLVQATETSVQ